MKILILGGTTEARELANRLVADGHDVITSLAGRTRDPKLPQGGIRMGRFGGIPGLAAYLNAAGIEALVDATHPYAGQISVNAVAAAEASGVPLVRVMRPGWEPLPGQRWTIVDTLAEAALSLPTGAEVLLTTGHSGLGHFLERDDCHFIVRLIEPPEMELPSHAELLLSRPPYGVDGEIELMQRRSVTHLVTKNSGGGQTAGKLEAAHKLGVTVIMIGRPHYGPALEVASVDAAVDALGL
ncbi:cobalt-precorrin-6A reductase [Devosia sp. SD17-2]|jgi:precorrin-6A/cobalt-precorrin-6A reductase|uniref:cobalt-precorrin-6A reductase n=1 Tax=Devosia sp. SD17-2 TaxID=2976459 RepID=UPI0023D8AAE5|nr:cobalt-precorrin-6A reductase [Devosia sp. SD17-2]WEJ32564.1 cobalt-precorrin-6A reductase [Devosia sp. SD17-2]